MYGVIGLILVLLMNASTVSAPQQAPSKTIWQGAYTEAQAARGKDAFATSCTSCHGADMEGINAPSLKGDVFMENWREDTMRNLFNYVKTTMPPRRPSLSDDAYLDIIAHIMQVNMFPAGADELKANSLAGIRIERKDGPKPLPDFALVQSVGCLTRASDGSWILINASDPIRTRVKEKSAPEDLKAASLIPLGNGSLRLIYPDSFTPGFRINTHSGHKMEAKGFFLKNPGDERLSVTWLEMLAETCGK